MQISTLSVKEIVLTLKLRTLKPEYYVGGDVNVGSNDPQSNLNPGIILADMFDCAHVFIDINHITNTIC